MMNSASTPALKRGDSQKMTTAVRSWKKVQRGLLHVLALAQSDVETGMADESPRWSKAEYGDIMAALDWLREQAR